MRAIHTTKITDNFPCNHSSFVISGLTIQVKIFTSVVISWRRTQPSGLTGRYSVDSQSHSVILCTSSPESILRTKSEQQIIWPIDIFRHLLFRLQLMLSCFLHQSTRTFADCIVQLSITFTKCTSSEVFKMMFNLIQYQATIFTQLGLSILYSYSCTFICTYLGIFVLFQISYRYRSTFLRNVCTQILASFDSLRQQVLTVIAQDPCEERARRSHHYQNYYTVNSKNV